MPRRVRKYDDAIKRYGLDMLKDLHSFFGRKPARFDKILKYHRAKEKERKIISAIEANCLRGMKVNKLVKQLHISRASYYRFITKYKDVIFSIKR
jgi:DNA invertase Pin-like site-specific DNA recombinase